MLVLPLLALTTAPSPSRFLEARDGAGNRVIEHTEGMNWYSYSLKDGNNGYSDEKHYTCFYGGPSNFPPISKWMNFEAMWSLNQRDYMNVKPQDTPAVQAAIKHAVIYISQCARVDPRVILAVMMQEVRTTSVFVQYRSTLTQHSHRPTLALRAQRSLAPATGIVG